MSDYDVLIYGAGPSGSYLGRLLSGRGFKTAIFDPRQEIGVPLYSGEGTNSSLVSEKFLIDSDRANLNRIDKIELSFVTPKSGRTPLLMHSSVNPGGMDCTVDRDKLDKEMASLAALSGCDLSIRKRLDSVRAVKNGFRAKFFGGENDVIEASILVRADGPDLSYRSGNCICTQMFSGRKFSNEDYQSYISLGMGGGSYVQDLSQGNGFRTAVIEVHDMKAMHGGWLTGHRMDALILYDPLPCSDGQINIGSRAIGQDPAFLNGLHYAALTSEMAADAITAGLDSSSSASAMEIYSESMKKIERDYRKNADFWRKLRGLHGDRLLAIQEIMADTEFHSISINELFFNSKCPIEPLLTDSR
ncbi:MAG: NAD(P)/FAD-dependent oxidoreductase [Candidatus Thermoplasmatota archaeon]|jgi:flavin-dependent dehydrogenase|nr:NAD(P)/FAD-dependent oxidoreductase [Candidatus Thermoplasmatota archaeon]